MSYNNFVVPDLRSLAAATEGLDKALSESGIPRMDLANALATRPQRRRPAPAPPGGVSKARQVIPGLPKARQRKDAYGQPLKRTAKACVDCRKTKVRCDGGQPCGRCRGKRKRRYDCTENEIVAMRADWENRKQREACERVASATQDRDLQPCSESPVKGLRELAAKPLLSPPLPEQVTESQFEPVQSTADLLGSNQFPPTPYTPTPNTPSEYTPTSYTPSEHTPTPYASTPYAPTPYAPTPYAPTPYAPTPYASKPYAPTPYAPTPYAPTQYAPKQYALTQYAPPQYAAVHYAPSGFGQEQFDPNYNDGTLGTWNSRTDYSSKYPPSETLPDEQVHHPRESRFTQREFSQVPSGSLQFREGFGYTDGAPMVQPGEIQPYADYPSIVYPDMSADSTSSNSVMPAQHLPWWPNDSGLESMDNAQTLAESSHHVERARSPAYIAAMMPPQEDWWA